MALDPTAREANVRASLKKFIIDNLYTVGGYKLTFDKGLAIPKLQGHEVDEWLSVQFGGIDTGESVSTLNFNIFCCTRKDKEGYELSNMRDAVVGYLTDISQPDGTRRIPLYNSNEPRPWPQVGSMVVVLDPESAQMTASDGTKYKIISSRLKWGSKI